jgi:hypothetical protein
MTLAIAALTLDAQVPPAALDAAKASPDLVSALSKELGSTPEQAAGAAGSLFELAKSRLKPDDFAQISKAVPGMDSLLKAAPSVTGGAGGLGAIAGSAGGLASAAAPEIGQRSIVVFVIASAAAMPFSASP